MVGKQRWKSDGTFEQSDYSDYGGIRFFYARVCGIDHELTGRGDEYDLVSDAINELYPRALDIGMKPQEFWDCSFAEINDILESHERAKLDSLKAKALEHCQVGYVIAGDICNAMSAEEHMIKPWDLYPKLFEEEQQDYEVEQYKKKMRDYAAELSRRREV